MKRGRWILVLILLVVGGIVAVVALRQEPEPVYNGKKLSEWLTAYQLGYSNEEQRQVYERERTAALQAVQAIGTNALPSLLHWIAYEPSPLVERLRSLAFRVRVEWILHWFWRGERQAMNGEWGFEILGPLAAPSVPVLTKLAGPPHRDRVRERARSALACVGRAGVGPLVAILESGPKVDRFEAAALLVRMHEPGQDDVGAAVPGLLLLDRQTRASARTRDGPDYLYAFSDLLADEGFVVPALVGALQHPNSSVRQEAVWMLGWGVGSTNAAVVAGLVKALGDSDADVRGEATNALGKVAPEVLQGHGR